MSCLAALNASHRVRPMGQAYDRAGSDAVWSERSVPLLPPPPKRTLPNVCWRPWPRAPRRGDWRRLSSIAPCTSAAADKGSIIRTLAAWSCHTVRYGLKDPAAATTGRSICRPTAPSRCPAQRRGRPVMPDNGSRRRPRPGDPNPRQCRLKTRCISALPLAAVPADRSL